MESLLSPKESRLNQKGIVIWFTGLSGSGKTTLATNLEKRLNESGFFTMLLDGDILRKGLNAGLGFSDEDRTENIRRAAEVSKLFADNAVVTLCAFITPTEQLRKMARNIIGTDKYEEVFVKCSMEECERRDIKGLYKKARSGIIPNFTGINSPFETPLKSTIIIDTEHNDVESCVERIFKKIMQRISVHTR